MGIVTRAALDPSPQDPRVRVVFGSSFLILRIRCTSNCNCRWAREAEVLENGVCTASKRAGTSATSRTFRELLQPFLMNNDLRTMNSQRLNRVVFSLSTAPSAPFVAFITTTMALRNYNTHCSLTWSCGCPVTDDLQEPFCLIRTVIKAKRGPALCRPTPSSCIIH